MAHDVFVSYSHRDKQVADAACAQLEARGIRCWIAPRDVVPGASWGGAIVKAIESSRVLLLIFSTHANRSRQVIREVERAINKGVVVVPMRLEDVSPSEDMEYFISSCHWLDALTPPLEQHLERLVSAVELLLSGRVPAEREDKAGEFEGVWSVAMSAVHGARAQLLPVVRLAVFSGAPVVPGEVALVIHSDGEESGLSVYQCDDGLLLWCKALPEKFLLGRVGFRYPRIVAEGELADAMDVAWLEVLDVSENTSVERKVGKGSAAEVASQLQTSLDGFAWLDPGTQLASEGQSTGFQAEVIDDVRLRVTGKGCHASWSAGRRFILAASQVFSFNRLIAACSDGALLCLRLRVPGTADVRSDGCSGREWYQVAVNDPSGDLQVVCLRCQYGQWLDRRKGEKPTARCPRCGC